MSDGTTESLKQVFHKEKNQKKYNTTTGQIDNMRGYNTTSKNTIDKSATDDKQIKREANLLKNIAIDQALERLRSVGLVNGGYDAWYCQQMHSLGIAKVTALAQTAIDKCRAGKHPAALFHFLLNKEVNKAADPYMPRFNR